jgi:pimeloyl-ACP methyl ester carboxylesterase
MGGYLAARLTADHPDRVAALVLIDGGLPLPLPPGQEPEELLRLGIEQATARLKMTFESVDEYVSLWRDHPAMLQQWNDDVEAYARYDVTGEVPFLRCVVSSSAVAADCRDLMYDQRTHTAVERVLTPIHLVRAERGLFDDDPVVPDSVVDAFVAAHPDATVETADGTNHYTLIFAPPGPARIAAAIEGAALALSARRGI